MNYFLEGFRKYATFSGRATRSEYWYFGLFFNIIYIVLFIFDAIIGVPLLTTIYILIIFIPSLSISVRRLHDIGKSGWWILLSLIPIIGILILLYFFVLDSKDDNEYGVNKKVNNSSLKNTQISIDELEKLSELKDKGIISEEEFNKKKKEILGV